jgi:creatinine amidohydrolase
MMWLERLRWTELDALRECVFVVPLGSLEQHGPHLPMMTDTAIITELARRIEKARPESVVVAPTLWLGHSPHHVKFGCVSLDVRPYMDMLAGICRSLVQIGASRILLLNGHGGNDIPAKAAMRELKTEFAHREALHIVYATYWALAAERLREIRTSERGGMGHACEMETSIMMTILPDDVLCSAAVDSQVADPGGVFVMDMLEGSPYYAVFNFDELSPTGTVGMPSHATAHKGARFLDAIAESATAFVDHLAKWKQREPHAGRHT